MTAFADGNILSPTQTVRTCHRVVAVDRRIHSRGANVSLVGEVARNSVDLFPVRKDGLWGCINRTGEMVIAPRFRGCTPFFEGLAKFVEAGRPEIKYGFMDGEGRVAIEARFEEAFDFREGLACVSQAGKWGLVDPEGTMTVAAEYDAARPMCDGLAPVKKGDQWGYVDREGHMVIPPAYGDAWSFSEGLAYVRISGKGGFIDKTGQMVIAPQFGGLAAQFSNGLACVQAGQRYRFIDHEGKVRAGDFDLGGEFSEGLAWVGSGTIGPLYHCIDLTGKYAFAGEVAGCRKFMEGLAAARIKSTMKWGFMNKEGQWVIEPKYDSVPEVHGAAGFRGGLACVGVKDKDGYLDKSGKFVWEPSE